MAKNELPAGDDDDTCCAVCLLELVEDGLATVRTACDHEFHLCCLLKCMEHQGTGCPICRQSIDSELSMAPRPWISSLATRNELWTSPLQGLAATEAAVAVEIAESVRRSLADEHNEESVAADVSGSAVSTGADDVAAAAMLRARVGRIASHGGSGDFPGDLRWYTEIVEAVARSLSEEAAQRPGSLTRNNASTTSDGVSMFPQLSESSLAHDSGVDPGALAGLEEAVGRLHDVSSGAALSAGSSALQRRMFLGVDPDALAGLEEAAGQLHIAGAGAAGATAVARRRATCSPASRSLPPQVRNASRSRDRPLPQQPEDHIPERLRQSPRRERAVSELAIDGVVLGTRLL